MPMDVQNGFVIRLLRSDHKPTDTFHPKFQKDGVRPFTRFEWRGIKHADLFIVQVYSKRPKWTNFIEGQVEEVKEGDETRTDIEHYAPKSHRKKIKNLLTSGSGAVLFVPVRERVLAICFGHVHLAMRSDAFEKKFGLMATLNTVSAEKLRSFDIVRLRPWAIRRHTQASKDSPFFAFDVDTDQDLALSVSGIPKDKDFAEFAYGKDSLKIMKKATSDQMHDLCSQALKMYNRENYRDEFSWINNMTPVENEDTIIRLDNELFGALQRLREGEDEALHIAIPDYIDYERTNSFQYRGFGGNEKDFPDVLIDNYISELQQRQYDGDIDELRRNHYIQCVGGMNGPSKADYNIYNCFVYEVYLEDEGNDYAIFDGSWYCVSADFKKSVEEFYSKIPKTDIIKKAGYKKSHNTELSLITELSNRSRFVELHNRRAAPDGVRYGSYELCDFLTTNRELICIKGLGNSNAISHLWMQGVVGTRSFIYDKEFRRKIRSKIDSCRKYRNINFVDLIPIESRDLTISKYTVVYGIMRELNSSGKREIPFFSMVSLKSAVKSLNSLGVNVKIEIIEVN